jgi:hypothetical protein
MAITQEATEYQFRINKMRERIGELLDQRDRAIEERDDARKALVTALEQRDTWIRQCDQETGIGDFFISAIKHYAGHTWNDLKQEINKRYPEADVR